MVERLKIAVDKARAQRAQTQRGAPQTPPPQFDEAAGSRGGFLGTGAPIVQDAPPMLSAWEELEKIEFDERHLERHRVITKARKEPAHIAFDVLRTRILRAFSKHGWTRLGITSPTQGCGKTFTSVNLAFSLSRQHDSRSVLMDMDLRAPSIARVLGVDDADRMANFLAGQVPAREYLRRSEDNLALGLNTGRIADPGEVMQSPRTAAALSVMLEEMAPDIVIYDLPPMLSCDDVLGFLGQLDCVLMVVGGGSTKPEEVTECERLLADNTHLLGVLLNRAEGINTEQYNYDYA